MRRAAAQKAGANVTRVGAVNAADLQGFLGVAAAGYSHVVLDVGVDVNVVVAVVVADFVVELAAAVLVSVGCVNAWELGRRGSADLVAAVMVLVAVVEVDDAAIAGVVEVAGAGVAAAAARGVVVVVVADVVAGVVAFLVAV
jgi:hypothetical protein